MRGKHTSTQRTVSQDEMLTLGRGSAESISFGPVCIVLRTSVALQESLKPSALAHRFVWGGRVSVTACVRGDGG